MIFGHRRKRDIHHFSFFACARVKLYTIMRPQQTEQTERDYFTFYRSFQEAIEQCDEKDQLALYRAIVYYGLDQKEPIFNNPLLRLAWTLIKPNLYANWVRYDNGRKGGAPKGNKNALRNNRETTEKQPKNNQKTSNKDKEKDKEIGIFIEDKSSLCEDAAEKKEEEIDYSAFLKCWNEAAKRSSLKQMTGGITERRRMHIEARFKECKRTTQGDIEAAKRMLFTVIKNAASSEWLQGEGIRFANFDWIFTHPTNFVKVLEGNYNQ